MSVFDDLKSAAKVLQEAGKIEQYKQILEAQEKLLEMQKKIADFEEENRSLKERLKTKEKLTYENDAYWSNGKGQKIGPFCSKCWEDEGKLLRMHYQKNSYRYTCPKCHTLIDKA